MRGLHDECDKIVDAAKARAGADRMAQGLSCLPNRVYGDLEDVLALKRSNQVAFDRIAALEVELTEAKANTEHVRQILYVAEKDYKHQISVTEAERDRLLAVVARVNERHSPTCQTIVIGSTHCDCSRRSLCDCEICIDRRNQVALREET